MHRVESVLTPSVQPGLGRNACATYQAPQRGWCWATASCYATSSLAELNLPLHVLASSPCRLAAAIKLKRLPEALNAARALGSANAWRQIAAAALQQLDVRLAMAAYRQVRMR
jgi:hypothetical protein